MCSKYSGSIAKLFNYIYIYIYKLIKKIVLKKFIYILLKIFFVGTGTDVAGEVVGVGSGVKNVKAGDKVIAMLGFAVKSPYLFH